MEAPPVSGDQGKPLADDDCAAGKGSRPAGDVDEGLPVEVIPQVHLVLNPAADLSHFCVQVLLLLLHCSSISSLPGLPLFRKHLHVTGRTGGGRFASPGLCVVVSPEGSIEDGGGNNCHQLSGAAPAL